jgi:hypothetical protein
MSCRQFDLYSGKTGQLFNCLRLKSKDPCRVQICMGLCNLIFNTADMNQERRDPPLKNGSSQTAASMLTRSWLIVSGAPIG